MTQTPTFTPREPGGIFCECGFPETKHQWRCSGCDQELRGYWGGFGNMAWLPDALGHSCEATVILYCPRPSLTVGRRPEP